MPIYYGDSGRKYNDTGRLYGSYVYQAANYIWIIEVDWDGDGVYSGENEDIYTQGLSTDRGWDNLYNTETSGATDYFAPPSPGSAVIKFENSSNRFSTWDTSGVPTNVMPGRLVRIRVRDGYSGTVRDVFAGVVTNIQEDRADKKVTITATDGITQLQEQEAMVEWDNISYSDDNAAAAVATSIGYPWNTNMVNIVPASYFAFWAKDRAIKVLNEIAKRLPTSLFYVAANGDITYKYFEYGVGTSYDSDKFKKNVDVSLPWENLKTSVVTNLRYWDADATAVLWTKSSDTLTIPASSSISFIVDYNYSEPDFMVDADALIASTDYVANATTDGLGADMTSDITPTLLSYGVSGSLTLTNASIDAAYITTLQVRGTPYVNRGLEVQETLTDFLGIGVKIFAVDSLYRHGYLGITAGTGDGSQYYGNLGYPHVNKQVTVQIETQAHQFIHDLADAIKINITDPYLVPLDWTVTEKYNNFRISKISHTWLNENGQSVLTTWGLRHTIIKGPPKLL